MAPTLAVYHFSPAVIVGCHISKLSLPCDLPKVNNAREQAASGVRAGCDRVWQETIRHKGQAYARRGRV